MFDTALYRYVTETKCRRALFDHDLASFGTQCSHSCLDIHEVWTVVVGPAYNLFMAGKGRSGFGSGLFDIRICGDGEVQVLAIDFV